MHSFTFAPTEEVPADTLKAPSTYAKIRIEPFDAYVDASVKPIHGSDRWTATIGDVPLSSYLPRRDHRAVLCLSRREFGKPLGTIQLGSI